jgi:hypothetical protein
MRLINLLQVFPDQWYHLTVRGRHRYNIPAKFVCTDSPGWLRGYVQITPEVDANYNQFRREEYSAYMVDLYGRRHGIRINRPSTNENVPWRIENGDTMVQELSESLFTRMLMEAQQRVNQMDMEIKLANNTLRTEQKLLDKLMELKGQHQC